MIRIINNKKVELTEDEWKAYQQICESYDKIKMKGSLLFADLFETDERGLITFIHPPQGMTSLEVFLFVVSIFCHQHVREMYGQVDYLSHNLNDKIKQVDDLIARLTSVEKTVSSTSLNSGEKL